MRHGDALQAERNIAEKQKKALAKKIMKKLNPERETNKGKICKAPDCDEGAKIKGYCLKHDSRLKRNNSLETKIARTGIVRDTCGVLDCNNPHKAHGMCETHLRNFKETGSPIRPKIVKHCGVKDCNKPHMAKGVCSSHYAKWKANIRDLGIIDYIERHSKDEAE